MTFHLFVIDSLIKVGVEGEIEMTGDPKEKREGHIREREMWTKDHTEEREDKGMKGREGSEGEWMREREEREDEGMRGREGRGDHMNRRQMIEEERM